jgi:hypothetical protein
LVKKTRNQPALQKEFPFNRIKEAKAILTFNHEHISNS